MEKAKILPKALSKAALAEVADPFQRAQLELLARLVSRLDAVERQLRHLDMTLSS